jgi:oligoendopeptidase F
MRPSSFVPADLDPADLAQTEPLYEKLAGAAISSVAELEQWLLDASDLEAAIDELHSRRYIAHTCHTDDAEIERSYLQFVEQIEPRLKPWGFEIKKKLVHDSHATALDRARFGMLVRSWANAVDLYREQNIPLETQETRLFAEYGKITGAMMIDHRGERRTVQQMAKLLDEPDRAVRREAFELIQDRRARDRQQLDDLFAELLSIRSEIARNAGFESYREHAFRRRERFDYSPADCLRFGDAIAEVCVPLVESLDRARRDALGVARLRPWDLTVDVTGRPALRPFEEGQIDVFLAKTGTMFRRISPRLGELFDRLEPGRNLDLDSRRGKRPGGYQASLEVSRQPFIFMNAVGTRRDVETLLHEGGHAFHFLEASREPVVFLRHAPMEFCEVASMSMELLGSAHLEVFYTPDDAARARRAMLEGIVRFLPWMAAIDGFQHWLYTHPGHSAQDRTAAWLAIHDRFSSREVDWSGFEDARAWRWQPQLHLFGMPFYYIEYGIAQLGAIQVWLGSRRDSEGALSALLGAFALGGTRTLPELFEAAGIRFDLSRRTLEPLMAALGRELEEDPGKVAGTRPET